MIMKQKKKYFNAVKAFRENHYTTASILPETNENKINS